MIQEASKSAAAIRGADRGYVAFHAPRYAFLSRLLFQCGANASSRILDIGPSRLTVLVREQLGAVVDSMGFGADQERAGGRHYEFDLNLAQEPARWRRDLQAYDFVLFAEVLEHLHAAPEHVLAFVKSLLRDDGTLILQTPNAASLQKRLKLLFGRHPYERIRLDPSNPGHFREYTRAELRGLLEDRGFRVRRCVTAFYFDARFARHSPGDSREQPVVGSLKNLLYRLLPPSLREGITIVAGNAKC